MTEPGADVPDRSVVPQRSAPPRPPAFWPPPPEQQPALVPADVVPARARWRGTMAVAAIVGAIVLGGSLADAAVAAPGAGEVAVSGPVHVTAAPGWTLTTAAGGVQDGVALQRGQDLLVVQVISTSYPSDDAQLLTEMERSLMTSAGQIWFGAARRVDLGGKTASEATFSALLSSGGGTGVVDGELVCLVLPSAGDNYAVLVQAGVPQGTLGSVTRDVDAMAGSVKVDR